MPEQQGAACIGPLTITATQVCKRQNTDCHLKTSSLTGRSSSTDWRKAGDARALLREIWRVTAEEGRILIVAANRQRLVGACRQHTIWRRTAHGPADNSRRCSKTIYSRSLLGHMRFICRLCARNLLPPGADTWERTGETLFAPFGGVVMVEAVKRLYIEPKGVGDGPNHSKSSRTADHKSAGPRGRVEYSPIPHLPRS